VLDDDMAKESRVCDTCDDIVIRSRFCFFHKI
jgi:hypothetical protein